MEGKTPLASIPEVPHTLPTALNSKDFIPNGLVSVSSEEKKLAGEISGTTLAEGFDVEKAFRQIVSM